METLEGSLLWLLLGTQDPDIREDQEIRSHMMELEQRQLLLFISVLIDFIVLLPLEGAAGMK